MYTSLKNAFKNQGCPIPLYREINRKTNQVLQVLRVECAPITGITALGEVECFK